jgi:hypothetical protein
MSEEPKEIAARTERRYGGLTLLVSVAIVNWNTRGLLSDCLESLSSTIEEGLAEVIVVDNGSIDGSGSLVERKFPQVTLIHNESNLGFTKATNQAFEAATAKYFLMLNSDTIVPRDAIRTCADFMERAKNVGILGCRIVYPDGSPQNSCFRFTSLRGVLLNSLYLSQLFRGSYWLNWDRYGNRAWDEPHEVDCVMGGFMIVRREAVENGPLLDEGYFMYGEEADLCYRMKRGGWKVIYYPGAEIEHHHYGSSTEARVSAWVYEARNRAALRFLMKWRGVGHAWIANLAMLLGMVPRSIAWLAGDAISSARALRIHFSRVLKIRAFRFHLSAFLRPALFDSSWELDADRKA